MSGDFGGGGGFAKSRNIDVSGISLTPSLSHWERVAGGRVRVTSPCVVGGDDLFEVGISELAVDAVDEGAHFPGVDEEGLLAAVTFLAVVLVPGEEPETDGDLGAVEELAGECDHAVDEVGLDEGLPDLSLAGLIRRHGAIRKNEAGHSLWGKVVDEVLDPGEVRIPLRRDAVLPADVVVFAKLVGVVEGGIGQDEVGPEVGVERSAEGVGVLGSEVGLDAPEGEVHDGEAAGGGVALLAVDADVAEFAAVGFHEFLALDEHAARSAGGVVDASPIRGDHLDEEADDAGGGVELAAILPLGARKLGEEVLKDATKEVLGAAGGIGKLDGADEVDELAEAVLIEVGAAVVLIQGALEAGVIPLEGNHGVVDVLTDGGELGIGLEEGPACLFRDPEDIGGEILVFVLGIGAGVVALTGDELGMVLFETVGDVLQEDKAEDDVLVLGRVHVVAKLVSGEPQFPLKADIGRGVLGGRRGGGFLGAGHERYEMINELHYI